MIYETAQPSQVQPRASRFSRFVTLHILILRCLQSQVSSCDTAEVSWANHESRFKGYACVYCTVYTC